eukprot:TRINITY_DN50_c0_g1_i1.p1 TRINITY_DN50_c0_g1~~TRINITY_DN50_c0_g1_i1.p1  ORF type:complete len:241 (-),score=52.82 TRINITY_DN50_c0_g1_i1:17-739(-)
MSLGVVQQYRRILRLARAFDRSVSQRPNILKKDLEILYLRHALSSKNEWLDSYKNWKQLQELFPFMKNEYNNRKTLKSPEEMAAAVRSGEKATKILAERLKVYGFLHDEVHSTFQIPKVLELTAQSGFSHQIHELDSGVKYIFRFRIAINNTTDEELQIVGRKWIIYDGLGMKEEIESEDDGEPGKRPIIAPGSKFEKEYSTAMKTYHGSLSGYYFLKGVTSNQIYCAQINPVGFIKKFK